MTVYIEYVLIDNFIIDFLILKATFTVSGQTTSIKRLFLCSIILSVFALLFPYVDVGGIISTSIKVAFGLLTIILAGKYQSFREYYITVLIFFTFTFLTGGGVTAIYSLLNLPFGTTPTIALAVLPIWLILKLGKSLIFYLSRKGKNKEYIYPVEICVVKKKVSCKGFLDTGNGLYDNGTPCVVCSAKLIGKLFTLSLPKMKKINVQTINGNSQKIAIQSTYIKIYMDGQWNIYNNVTLVLSNAGFDDGYQIILHPSLFKENYVKSNNVQTEKAS
ncbi:MAG: sigma-E processing peptidase SpoIIGA [Clostridia bacterium]|nr:sigma-E processing peptidase SpoIIGA [Clostridia bacterium]